MLPSTRLSRLSPGALVGAFVLAVPLPSQALAQTPVAVTIDASSTLQYRANLANRSSSWYPGPMNATLELSVPAAAGTPVVFRNLRFNAPSMQCIVPNVGAGAVTVSLTQFAVVAAPGSGASLPTTSGQAGAFTFAGTGVSGSVSGAAQFSTIGNSCLQLTNAGAPCSGQFNMATPGANTNGIVEMGVVTPGSPRTFSLHYYASFPMVSGTTWGSVDVLADLTGSLASSAPACPADFNSAGGLNVQDIFDFLAAWFAANPAADFNHVGGLTVQDIFDFLAAWFAGCP